MNIKPVAAILSETGTIQWTGIFAMNKGSDKELPLPPHEYNTLAKYVRTNAAEIGLTLQQLEANALKEYMRLVDTGFLSYAVFSDNIDKFASNAKVTTVNFTYTEHGSTPVTTITSLFLPYKDDSLTHALGLNGYNTKPLVIENRPVDNTPIIMIASALYSYTLRTPITKN